MSLTKLSLGELFPAWESLISDIPAGEGKTANLFLQYNQPSIKLQRSVDFDQQPKQLHESISLIIFSV
jgi:hypothetical protein